MRMVVAGMLGVLFGVLLGRLGPAQELSELKAEASERLENPDCETQTLGRDLAVLMGGGLQGMQSAPPPEPEFDEAELEAIWDQAEQDAEVLGEEAEAGLREAANDEELIRALQAAVELRRNQARAALVEDADPSDAQLDEFDVAVADMNESLQGLAQDLVDMLEEGETPGRRDAMVFAAEALDTMIDAEDRIWDSLDEGQRESVDEASIDPFSYVDQHLLGVLAELGESP
ncbi:MAG: hypothetical protein VX519_04090 [Myxococcota bacterium]|nr:hypothetical protein [Myxococcota bacterium]